MSRSDYAHHNEEQDRIWWEEEGKHESYPQDPPDPDDDDWRDEPEDDEEDESDD